MAVIPDRTRMRAAKVLKLSPPSKKSMSTVAVFLVQLPCAASAPPSPSTSSDSSARATVVAKSWRRLDESLAPQTPMQRSTARTRGVSCVGRERV